jgi:hypothetical protein
MLEANVSRERSIIINTIVSFSILVAFDGPAAAQPPPAAPAGEMSPEDARKAEARERFEKGVRLLKQRLFGPALAELLLSRTLYPTWSATSAAAVCLRELQRYDEALDMFEALVRDFAGALPAETKEAAARSIVELRGLVGTIDIQEAEIGSSVYIDGQLRGDYPLLSPLRVPAGSHLLRVHKEGFHAFEQRIDVAGGKTASVTARLRALARAGRLRVIEQGGKILDVVIRGSVVGKTPWEGQLDEGEHTIFLRGEGRLGTQPVSVSVRFRETTPLILAAEELEASLRVEPTPAGASVAIDSVVVARGTWEGRLRAGEHKIEVAAPGFLPLVERVSIPRAGSRVLSITLQRDPTSPFAPKAPRKARFIAELGEGVALTVTFGGDIVGGCSGSCSRAVGVGGYGVVRGGYELGSGLGFGLSAGYFTLWQRTSDRSTVVHAQGIDTPHQGVADDLLRLSAPFAGGWVGYSLGERIRFHFRAGAGAARAIIYNERSGVFTASGGKSYKIGPVSERHSASLLFLSPDLRVGLQLGRHVELNLGVEAPLLIIPSPPEWGPPEESDDPHPIYAGTDGFGTFGADQLLSHAVILLVPGLGARFDF